MWLKPEARWLFTASLAVLAFASPWEVFAGCGGFFRARAVGGISINPEGVVAEAEVEHRRLLRDEIVKELRGAPEGMQKSTEIRKVSLRGLDRAIADAYKNNMGVVPEEVEFLGGLQRIQYVFVYPEQGDIVLAGPGEGWKVDAKGNVVGETTGRPVLHLDDLIVALRTAHAARTEGISCSIDPTPEGRRNLSAFLARQKQFTPAVIQGVEEAMGLQQVSFTGVPQDTRFARMMVAADYRMKRLAMKLEAPPIQGLPSYLDLVPASGGSMTPRWWLACNYDPLARSEDGLAWELRGQGVKVLTEDEIVDEDGTIRQTGRASAPAQRWADLMTEKYEELAVAEPVFGELRNLMDLCVAAAIIAKHDLVSAGGCELPMLLQQDGGAVTTTWVSPKSVATQCSFIKRGRNYVITASGGVQIESWQAASNTETSPHVAELRQKSASSMSNWWWN